MATVYVGTYTQTEAHVKGKGEGIYHYDFDPESASLTLKGITTGIVNPSYIALGPEGRTLYAVSEVLHYEGRPGGAVYAFAVDPSTHELALINRQRSEGAAPCYVSVEGGHVLVANYMGGTVAVLQIRPDGSLGKVTDAVQHVGSSVNTARQEAPHPHCIVPDRSGRFVHIADLGTDQVVSYRFDHGSGVLAEGPKPVQLQPGAGPRHLTFDAAGRFAYLMNELDSTVTLLSYESATGQLRIVDTFRALPEDFAGTPSGADIHVSPSGSFVYGSLRSIGRIVHFAVEADSGRLRRIGLESTRGRTPRNFGIDPTGSSLFALNQDSDTIVMFRIDSATGVLTPTAAMTDVPSPACIRFFR